MKHFGHFVGTSQKHVPTKFLAKTRHSLPSLGTWALTFLKVHIGEKVEIYRRIYICRDFFTNLSAQVPTPAGRWV